MAQKYGFQYQESNSGDINNLVQNKFIKKHTKIGNENLCDVNNIT
jgi:hypothetical protein